MVSDALLSVDRNRSSREPLCAVVSEEWNWVLILMDNMMLACDPINTRVFVCKQISKSVML